MFRKSGNHFFDQNMLKALILRDFFSFRRSRLNGKRARLDFLRHGKSGALPIRPHALPNANPVGRFNLTLRNAFT